MKSNLGMWMPKQKDGKNWIVNYEIILNGETKRQSRKFRVRHDAQVFINRAKQVLSRDGRVETASFKLSKIC